MNISYLIQVLQNKITTLNNAKHQAFMAGDINQVEAIDKEIVDTQTTFSQLNMLVSLNQAAVNANTTPAEVVAIGLDAVQNEVQGPSASAIVNGYDISAYATDALHEQKIQTIVNGIPALNVVSNIDAYIQSVASGSPVTGNMIISSAGKFNVNIPLLLAIMQNDSMFGTLGVGARTFNPGNVGNTGSKEVNFGSWELGVDAVAEWLAAHRIYTQEEIITPVTSQQDTPPVADPVPEEVVPQNEDPAPESEPEPQPIPEPAPENTPVPNTVPETISAPETTPDNSATTTLPVIDPGVASSTLDMIPQELVTTTPPPLIDTSSTTEATTTPTN